jgi:signal peptidase I
MLTLSLVDIDRDEFGQPRPHFLIKRAVGVGGDWFIPERGNLRIRPAGESRWMDENEFIALQGMTHNVSRLMEDREYPIVEAAGTAAGYIDLGLPVPPDLASRAARINAIRYPDASAFNKARLEMLRGAYPHETRYSILLARRNLGWYVPETRIFPLGDNRDNSRDGRDFGPVRSSRILGRASIIYWPGDALSRGFSFNAFQRFGSIK